MMKFHSCMDVTIADCSDTKVRIQQPCCCCNPVSMYTVDYPCTIDIIANDIGECTIGDALDRMVVNIQPTVAAIITMEWVCGVGFSERYLCGCDSELITIDGNYLVVKYKPES